MPKGSQDGSVTAKRVGTPTPKMTEWLKAAVGSVSVSEGRPRVSGQAVFDYELACYLLAYSLKIKGFERHDLAKTSLVGDLVFRMAARGSDKWCTFDELLNDALKNRSRKPLSSYVVVFATNISPPAGRSACPLPFDCLGNTISFLRASDLPSSIRSTFDKAAQRYRKALPSFTFFARIDVEARDKWDAFYEAHDVFGVFRGLLNFVELQHRRRRRWSVTASPMTRFLPPPLYYVFERDFTVALGPLLHNLPLTWKAERIQPAYLRRSRELSRALSRKENTTRFAIAKAVSMYTQSLDLLEPWQQFLGLWQVLEFLGRTQSGRMSDRVVLGRLGAMVEHAASAKDLLPVIHAKRNRVVHEGAYDLVVEEDVTWAKLLVDVAIQFYFDNRRVYPTREHMDAHAEYRSLSPGSLKARKAVLFRFLSRHK